MKLVLDEFQLEKDKKCFYDYMEFFEGNNTDKEHIIGNRMCGSDNPRTIESKGQKLSIVFNSDKSKTFKGFHAQWQTKEISKNIFNNIFNNLFLIFYCSHLNKRN